MRQTAHLLDDAQMQEFIRNGYISFKTDLPPHFHDQVRQRLDAVFEKEGNPGNNLLPLVPAIQRVFDDPQIYGALQSILGPNYYLHPHRHCHLNTPNSQGQNMHKDSWSKRHHRTRWGMAFYYPQDTPVELGPTGVVPGSHYHNGDPAMDLPGEVPLTGEAGTVVLVHYDLWHRAMPNSTERSRYMIKFLFTRLEEPSGPSWDGGGDWPASDDPRQAMWQSMWDWHRGQRGPALNGGHIDDLHSENEGLALQAAYRLDAKAIPALIDLLAVEDAAMRRNAGYAPTALGEAAVPALIAACADTPKRPQVADALGDIGTSARAAIPVLTDLLTDASEEVRRNAIDALGTIATDDPALAANLAPGLADADEWVSRNTALALLRLGSRAESATDDLVAALDSDNRYVSAKATQTLKRIESPAARDALLDHLLTARWCPTTSAASTF